MFHYKITKYNPKYRNHQGVYLQDEWTSYSDIGKQFQGVTLDYITYLKIENSYVNIILGFMECGKIDQLCIKALENCYANRYCVDIKQFFSDITVLKNETYLNKLEVANIVRLILREQIWCKLEVDAMYVHFGWDYYMYIGSKKECKNVIKETELFVETCSISPYSE